MDETKDSNSSKMLDAIQNSRFFVENNDSEKLMKFQLECYDDSNPCQRISMHYKRIADDKEENCIESTFEDVEKPPEKCKSPRKLFCSICCVSVNSEQSRISHASPKIYLKR